MNLIQWLLNDYGFINSFAVSSLVILAFFFCLITLASTVGVFDDLEFVPAFVISIIFAGVCGFILIVKLGPSIENANKYGSAIQRQNLYRCIKLYQAEHPYSKVDDNNIEYVTAFCNNNRSFQDFVTEERIENLNK
ncbi:hypothetical protein [Neisseria animaloris]|uniref:hypothetical protein n=1 Tax=Neisseria animaloris TaxID=326522 RepID=UPI0039E1C383